MSELATYLAGLGGIHAKIVADVPALQRGRVWCLTCGKTRKIDAAKCLATGWPKCCGYTMTIDKPKSARRAPGKEKP